MALKIEPGSAEPLSPVLSEDDGDSGGSWHAQDSQPPSPDSAKSATAPGPTGLISNGNGNSNNNRSNQLPLQKRRRVTRACDECRRKKIKCDGKSPCTHCTVYSYECTYDKPSNRRRNPAPQYVEALENRLELAETLLRNFIPNVDLTDPSLDPAVIQEFRKREQARAHAPNPAVTAAAAVAVAAASAYSFAPRSAANANVNAPKDNTGTGNGNGDGDGDGGCGCDATDGELTSMLESIGQLELDDGGWDFHGTSSGAVWLQRMKEHFSGRLGDAPFLPRPRTRPVAPQTLEPSPAVSPFEPAATGGPELPPRDAARSLCFHALTRGTCLVRIVHVPSFYEAFDRVYDTPVDGLSVDDMRFVGLLYAVMSLGCMYKILDVDDPSATWKTAVEEGTHYHNASRAIIPNIADSRDLTSLQALMFRIYFLQSTSSLSTTYSLQGVALRCALRMGLHRYLRHEDISPVEQEVRRRVFWAIRQMDIYTSVILGFPIPLGRDQIDQAYPTEVDDEYVTAAGVQQPPPGTPSFFQAFNAMTRLMEILATIASNVYPMRGLGTTGAVGSRAAAGTSRIGYAKIKEIEAELARWYERLPEAWRPISDGPVEVVRVRHLLRFTYAHVQLVFYRPFLHYVSPRLSRGKRVDEVSYACAAAGISVSRNIIHIGTEIRKQGALSGQYWFMLYTEYFAALSLVFYAIENPEKAGSMEVLADARCGRENVAKLAQKSLAAETITGALDILFEQIPPHLETRRTNVPPTKKRAAPTPSGRPPPAVHTNTNTNTQQSQSRLPLRRCTDSRNSPASNASPVKGLVRRSTSGVQNLDHPPHSGEAPPPLTRPGDAVSSLGTVDMLDFLPVEAANSRATPDSGSGTPASAHSHLPDASSANNAPPFAKSGFASLNALHRLNSLMFPSPDPFAYPNQPMMELGFHQGQADRPVPGGMMAHATPAVDASQLFMTRGFDELDAHLLGQAPSFPIGAQTPHRQDIDLGDAVFDATDLFGLTTDTGQAQLRGPKGQGREQPQQPDEEAGPGDQMFLDQYPPGWDLFATGEFEGM